MRRSRKCHEFQYFMREENAEDTTIYFRQFCLKKKKEIPRRFAFKHGFYNFKMSTVTKVLLALVVDGWRRATGQEKVASNTIELQSTCDETNQR